MAKYKLSGDGIRRDDGAFIPRDERNRDYRAFLLWCEGKDEFGNDLGTGPNEPDPEFTETELAERAKAEAVDAVVSEFKAAIAKPVKCIAGGKTYFMDGLEESAVKMKHGIELAELTGKDSMDVVDYYNEIHEGVPLADCYEIMLQQAASYLAAWENKSKGRSAILFAKGGSN